MSIQAMKGVEIGDGFEVAGRRGSEAHDEILWDDDAGEYTRGSHPRRRHRGRHDHRRPARGARRDEAARHAEPPGAARPSTSRPRRRRSRSRSAPTSPRCPRPAWSPRRWSRSCSRPRHCASSAATRWPSSSRNHAAYIASLAMTCRSSTGTAPRARRADGRGEDDRRAALRRAARPAVRRHRRARRGDRRACRSPSIWAAEGEPGFRARERVAVADAAASPDAARDRVRRWRGARPRQPPRAARPRASSCGSRRRPTCSRRASADDDSRPLLAGGDRPPRSSGSATLRAPAYEAAAARARSTPTGRTRRRGRRRRRWRSCTSWNG